MPTNEYLPFAVGGAANIETQANFAAASSTTNGFQTGIAPAKNMNKAYRQSSVVASAIAQAICDTLGVDMLDDGNVTNFKTQFIAMLRALVGVPVGGCIGVIGTTAPVGYLKINGAAVSTTTYASLATALYVGDANNATANWGYKCTDPANPSTTRSTTGGYIKLPDFRGRHLRGLDDGAGIDTGRTIYIEQLDQVLTHTHSASTDTQGSHTHTGYTDVLGGHSHGLRQWAVQVTGTLAGAGMGIQGNGVEQSQGGTEYAGDHQHSTQTYASGSHAHNVTITATGGSENRVRNMAVLWCVKY